MGIDYRRQRAMEAKEKATEAKAYGDMSMVQLRLEIARLQARERGLLHEIKELNRALDEQIERTKKMVAEVTAFIRKYSGGRKDGKG